MFYYNGLPGGTSVTCWIDDVKALAELDEATLTRTALTVGTQRIEFAASLHEGERLVFFPGEQPEIIPARAGERRKLEPTEGVQVSERRTVTLQAAEPLTISTELRLVQDCPEELPLTE